MQENSVSCKNCGNVFEGKYCNRCGEKVFTNHDKSVFHFFEESLHFLTHFEGTFFNTLGAITSRPGKLSTEFTAGKRKKYFKPLSFFMVLVILYLIFPFFTGLNMPFRIYFLEKEYAHSMVTKKTGINADSIATDLYRGIQSKNFKSGQELYAYSSRVMDTAMRKYPKLAKLEASYNKSSEKVSKILLLILIPFTALCLYVLSFRTRPYLYDNLVMATEINSVYLLFSFLIAPLLLTLLRYMSPAFVTNYVTDGNLGIVSYIVVGIYTSLSFRRFYNDPWYIAIPKAYVIIYAHIKIVQVIYKFILFAVTLSIAH